MPDKFGDKIRLQHTNDAVERIQAYIGNADLADFKADLMLQDACIRQLEVVGEAMNHVSRQLQNKHPEINWPQISGLRNIIVHEYFGIDAEVIWNIIKNDLPYLAQSINPIIEILPDDE